jgi:hypothetical protein
MNQTLIPLQKVMSYLDGKKTYIFSVILAVFTLLKVFNIITTTIEQDTAVYGLIASLLGLSIKSAIKKAEVPEEDTNEE